MGCSQSSGLRTARPPRLIIIGHVDKHRLDFGFSQDGGQARGLFGVDQVRQVVEFDLQDFAVEKKDGAEWKRRRSVERPGG